MVEISTVEIVLSLTSTVIAYIAVWALRRKSFPDLLMDLQAKADKYRAQIWAIERLLEANGAKKREA